jgi:hypothetical protein
VAGRKWAGTVLFALAVMFFLAHVVASPVAASESPVVAEIGGSTSGLGDDDPNDPQAPATYDPGAPDAAPRSRAASDRVAVPDVPPPAPNIADAAASLARSPATSMTAPAAPRFTANRQALLCVIRC